jgi:hypothetical protein
MSFEYDDSPSRLDAYISPDEAAEIARADPRIFTKDVQRFSHFASRVATTIKAMRSQILDMHKDINSVQLSRGTTGAPATLSPLEAVRYLTPEQRASIAGAATEEIVSNALATQRQADELKSLATSRINEVKLVLGSLADNPRLDEQSRTLISTALERFSKAQASLTDIGSIFTE